MDKRIIRRGLRKVGHFFGVVVGACALTLAFFLVLPVLQAIQERGEQKERLAPIESASFEPPPPPPPEDEPEEEEQEEEKPPELTPEAAPLSLDELNVAMNAGFGTGFGGAALASRLNALAEGGGGGDGTISFRDLDQKPRVVYQANPVLSARARKKTPGKVVLLFTVDQRGRVQNPQVQTATDPVFERPAIAALKKWKFEPGKKDGKPVSFRMRVPITFPKT